MRGSRPSTGTSRCRPSSPTRRTCGVAFRPRARVAGEAAALAFEHVRSSVDASGNIHWSVLPSGPPAAFDALEDALRAALDTEDIVAAHRRRAHVTISYRAPSTLPATRIRPVAWTIDAIELVSPAGAPYRYVTLGRWTLAAPSSPRVGQPALPV